MAKKGDPKVLEINAYLNSVPNLAKLSGKSLKVFNETVLGVEKRSYHNLRLGTPGDGDVVVWNEYFECAEGLGKRRKEIKFNGDALPKNKKCSITSVVVLDCFDDAYEPFSRIKSGGLYQNEVLIKISSKPFVGFAVRVVITAKLTK